MRACQYERLPAGFKIAGRRGTLFDAEATGCGKEAEPMPSIDMPLEPMRQYKPSLYREADFEEFWEQTVREAIKQPLTAELIPYELSSSAVECFAVRFDGYGGGRLAGWYLRPRGKGKFEDFPAPAGDRHSHIELLRQHEPGAVDQVPHRGLQLQGE
jgi:hypothetical protein